MKTCFCFISHAQSLQLCLTLWTPWIVPCQDPLSIWFFRQEYWSGLLFLCPGDLPDLGIKSVSPAWRWILYCWTTAAAAKSLQSCPTLCNPIDGSPPGSPNPGILQARTLEQVAISFSSEPPGNVHAMLCLVAQSCPILCNPTDCSLPGSSLQGDSPGKNTGVGCQAFLQGIFPTQGSNPGLLHCGFFTDWNTSKSNQGLLKCKWIL